MSTPSSYLLVLGRQPEISLAELEAQGAKILKFHSETSPALAEVTFSTPPDFSRFGGSQKIAIPLQGSPLKTLLSTPDGKITFGISDFTGQNPTPFALRLKHQLVKQGRSVRVVDSRTPVISCAANLHNGLSGTNPRKLELIHFNNCWYRVTWVQNIDSYAQRDQKRPARDPKIGMLPPKLAQMLLNLASALPPRSRILDPFCGTGVVLQEALLMNYSIYGTDIDPRMIEYSRKNLTWLENKRPQLIRQPGAKICSQKLQQADATTFHWSPPLDAIVTEGYLGRPFSRPPEEIELKTEIQTVRPLVLSFLRNLHPQITSSTPVVLCTPAWLNPHLSPNTPYYPYQRLNILDDIKNLGYNVSNKTLKGLLYHREGQIVARDIIILRKQ